MNKIIVFVLAFISLFGIVACEKENPIFDDSDSATLVGNIGYTTSSSFSSNEVEVDVWFSFSEEIFNRIDKNEKYYKKIEEPSLKVYSHEIIKQDDMTIDLECNSLMVSNEENVLKNSDTSFNPQNYANIIYSNYYSKDVVEISKEKDLNLKIDDCYSQKISFDFSNVDNDTIGKITFVIHPGYKWSEYAHNMANGTYLAERKYNYACLYYHKIDNQIVLGRSLELLFDNYEPNVVIYGGDYYLLN